MLYIFSKILFAWFMKIAIMLKWVHQGSGSRLTHLHLLPDLIKVSSRNKGYFKFAHATFHCVIIKSLFHVDNPKKYSSANEIK